jgi:hypothetical protein
MRVKNKTISNHHQIVSFKKIRQSLFDRSAANLEMEPVLVVFAQIPNPEIKG